MLAHLLRPIVRFCLNRSLKLQTFIEVAKHVFLEVANEQLAEHEKSATISRLSVATGVHRKDVERLMSGKTKAESGSDVLTRVVGQWQNDSRFSRKGTPLPLSLEGGSGRFSLLVKSVSKEINPYTILFELERLGFVQRDGDLIVLVVAEYAPRRDPEEAFRLVSLDFADIIDAAERNTFRTSAADLHLTTRYDNISVEALPKIRKWVLDEGAKFHKKVRTYLSRFDKDMNPRLGSQVGGGRVSVGTFSVSTGEEETERKKS